MSIHLAGVVRDYKEQENFVQTHQPWLARWPDWWQKACPLNE